MQKNPAEQSSNAVNLWSVSLVKKQVGTETPSCHVLVTE